MNSINQKQQVDSVFFQRLSMLMIYELENPENPPQVVIKPYENSYSVFALLTDAQGNVVYQSNSLFPTDISLLLKRFSEKSNVESTVILNHASATTQDGISSFSGVFHDKYWGISAIIVDRNGTIFHLRLLLQQKTALELIKKQLPLSILIWLVSLLCVTAISHFLLRYAMNPTEKVLKSQKDFIAAASHELKAPLAVILANNDKISSLNDNIPDIRKASNIINTESMRMSKLIHDMLFLASSDAGTHKISKSMVNLDTLLISLYESFEPVCSQKGMPLDADFMDVHFPVLYTDRECLFQILSIFMDNALSHSERKASIQIKAALSYKTVTISILDHGQGISAEDMPYIFNRFYCADKSHTDKSHFGLGLSIAKELAGFLSANVGVKNTEGGGATFFLTLPLK
ncbi:MAG: HAMP domain-containing histidine kinase [Lachnospiraceae bacterium]|nr:HAMP domain-containing histidine kinase [Lachnospiraceae bacterium]